MKLRLICIALLILPATAMAACVDTIHGSICIQHTDLTQKSWDNELNLTRVYHSSASSETGWFGHGWGTVYETRLIVMPDGSAVVENPSTTNITRYGFIDPARLQAEVVKIVATAIEREHIGGGEDVALFKQLMSNEELRRARVLKYGMQGQLPLKAKLHMPGCPKAVVERIATGYRRVSCEGDVAFFDLAGRLVRQGDKDYEVTLHYAGEHPDLIEDTLGQKILLKWTPAGHVAAARTGKDAPVVRYRYDKNENLVLASEALKSEPPGGDTIASGVAASGVAASEAQGKDTRYTHDANHKLTQMDNPDGSYMGLQYDESGRLAFVDDVDNSKVSYSYRHDPANPELHYWTTAKTPQGDGEPTIREAEYFLARDSAGVERLVRVIKTQGREKEEIALDETERVKRVEKSGGSFSEFSYHPTLGKMSVLVTDAGRREFRYDRAGNLLRVSDEKGHLIVLGYDSRSRIIRMVDVNKAEHVRRELAFGYNAHDKPTRIRMLGKGEINVEYGPEGDIVKVNSRQGAAMALAVTAAFQELLAQTKVAAANFCL